MATARTIIRKAMQKAGILSKTEQPSADEASDALDTLNDLFGSLANDALMTKVRTVEQFSMTANVASYTIGAGGDFNTSRPVSVLSGYIRSGTVDYPLSIIADTTYDRNIDVKSTQSIPEFYSYDNNYPLGRLTFYPVPSSAYSVFLRLEKPISDLTLDQDIDLQPGWSQYLIYQLAVLLAPEYAVKLDPKVEQIANQSKEAIMKNVAKNMTMDMPPLDEIGQFSIYSGRYK